MISLASANSINSPNTRINEFPRARGDASSEMSHT